MNEFVQRLLAVSLFCTIGCNQSSSTSQQKATPPAKVEKIAKEADLATITLTPEAETRLGIRTVPMERRKVGRTRLLGGQVVVPPGHSAVVVAPLTGTLAAPEQNEMASAGQQVKKGQPIFAIHPLLNPTDRVRLAESLVSLAGARVESAGQAEKARIQVESAKIVLARAEQLVRDKAGSVKGRDEAAAQLAIAESTLTVAVCRWLMSTGNSPCSRMVPSPVQ